MCEAAAVNTPGLCGTVLGPATPLRLRFSQHLPAEYLFSRRYQGLNLGPFCLQDMCCPSEL